MSKSIKDYKDAMDNIKISESFYKRTESLLTELPEIEIGKKPVLSAGRITAALSAAAACLIVAFGVKFAVERNDNITTVETEITEITEVSEVSETAPPIIDDISESEEDDIFDADYDDIVDADSVAAVEAGAPAAHNDTPDTPPPSEVTVTQPPAPANPAAGSAERTAAPPAVTAAPESKKPAQTTASSAPEETVPLLSDISYEHVTVEITPYFNMGNIKSGENPVKKTGEDCRSIIEFIEGLTETSRKISNYSFTSLFSMQVADESIGVTFYSIYVTDLNAVVITKHDANGQVRETYAVNKSDYEALKHILFLQFGTEDDYELFSSLVSGK
ncbi:MAG: hypothetical protein K2K34_00370, partial [Oscillospiraceae bacterium]|nr:hypothetical protein [Oscillospiraceae bacterium]